MVMRTNRLLNYLDEQKVEYHLLPHPTDFTAQRTAADTHTPGREFAKPVILEVGERQPTYVMVVMPAPHKVNMAKARERFGDHTALAPEPKLVELFPDCELGAEPPLGQLYGLPVYVAPSLAEDEWITFNAGTHEEAVRIRYADFERLARPEVIDIE